MSKHTHPIHSKAATARRRRCFVLRSLVNELFAGDDSVVGANGSASAAVDACVGIDVIDITCADCVYRADTLASATCHTVVSNYVCHNSYSFVSYC